MGGLVGGPSRCSIRAPFPFLSLQGRWRNKAEPMPEEFRCLFQYSKNPLGKSLRARDEIPTCDKSADVSWVQTTRQLGRRGWNVNWIR